MPLKTRRQFLELARTTSGIALARAALGSSALGRVTRVLTRSAAAGPTLAAAGMTAHTATPGPQERLMLNPATLARFVDPLPIPPVMASEGTRPSPTSRKDRLPYYRIEMSQIETRLHRDLAPTRQWGYAASVPGPTFTTRSGQGMLIEWVNKLPVKHLLPVDHTLHGAEADKPEVRTVAHVHGAKAPPASDGYPESWHTPGQSRIFHYPNEQEAATLWYHDHAMGITRLNIFAGLFGVFIVTDAAEEALNLPRGAHDIPLVMYDRTLDHEGQLFYPVSANPASPFVSEFYGNAILCNGKIHPYFEVQPRKYRVRLLNAANGRFLHLTLSGERVFHQIGTDLGLLPAPLELHSLVLFPAERADVILDFAGLAGQEVRLRNESEEVLQFRVARKSEPDSSVLPPMLRSFQRTPESQAVRERLLTLAEHDDAAGNSMQMLLNEAHWDMPVTETPVLDTTEIWSFVNLTGDAHPIHLHLVRFQILDRRPFDLFAYNADQRLVYTAPALPPEPGEMGWKDTVRADPGMVTRIIIRFEGYTGRYVWHCHLLEHEDNEMMRPYDIVPATRT